MNCVCLTPVSTYKALYLMVCHKQPSFSVAFSQISSKLQDLYYINEVFQRYYLLKTIENQKPMSSLVLSSQISSSDRKTVSFLPAALGKLLLCVDTSFKLFKQVSVEQFFRSSDSLKPAFSESICPYNSTSKGPSNQTPKICSMISEAITLCQQR